MKKVLIHTYIRSNITKEKYQKKAGLLLFFILHSLLAIGQNDIDSIVSALINSNKKEELIQSSEWSIANKQKIADSLIVCSHVYIKKGDFTKAMNAALGGLIVYKTLNDHKSTGNCFNKIASIHYYQGDYHKALSSFDQSILYYKKAGFTKGVASSTNNKGAIHYYLGNYPKALDNYKQAVKLNEQLNNERQTAATIQNIGGIYLELNDYPNAMKHFLIAKRTYEKISDKKTLSQVLNAIGEINLRLKEYPKASANFEKALLLAQEIDDKQRILETLFNLGELYDHKKDLKTSLSYYRQTLHLSKEIKNALYNSLSLIAIGSINAKQGKKTTAVNNCKEGLRIAKKLKTVSVQKDACKCLYTVYKSMQNDKIALAYFEESINLKDSLNAKQTADKILNMEFEKQMLRDSIAQVTKRRELQAKHKQVLQKKEKQRNIILTIGFLIIVFAIGLWSRLNFIRKSKAALQVEKDRSEELLLNILPEEIAEELKEKGYVDARDFDVVSIIFTDFKSFTETASKLPPKELVAEINACFKAFDSIMDRYHIEKIKTIGDAYMAAGGLPKPDSNSVKNTILAGIAMQEYMVTRKHQNEQLGKPAFEMRVGIHAGPIVAGIVGVKKFQYDVWGDTVNTASRMESNGAVGKVNISQQVYEIIKKDKSLVFEYRGDIQVKGKGKMKMYFVSKRLSFDRIHKKRLAVSLNP